MVIIPRTAKMVIQRTERILDFALNALLKPAIDDSLPYERVIFQITEPTPILSAKAHTCIRTVLLLGVLL